MKRILVWIIHVFDHVLPKQGGKIVLRGYPDLEDQCLAVLVALARRGYPGRVVWLMRAAPSGLDRVIERYGLGGLRLRICRTTSPEALFHFLTARRVLFTHGTYSQGDWGNYTPPRRKTVVNMWHGMPIKSIWRFLPEAIEAPRSHAILATSPRFQRILAEASGMEPARVWVLGLPRNDLLAYRHPAAEEAIRDLVGDRPWFLYLPTYRKSREGYITVDGCEHDSVLSMSGPDTRALEAWLAGSGIGLVVKPHPMSVHAGAAARPGGGNILVIDEGWLAEHQLTLYGLAGYSSGLITDLSSIAVDYLLLGKPVFVYFPDRGAYVRGRGTVFANLEENLPGNLCEDVASLIGQLEMYRQGGDPAREKRNRLLAEWHTFTEGSAADRLLDALEI